MKRITKQADLLIDLSAFSFITALAYRNEWSVTDLVWSLWISSLVMGYSIILISIGSGLIKGDMGGVQRNTSGSPVPKGLQSLPLSIFLLLPVFGFLGVCRLSLFYLLFVVLSAGLATAGILRDKKRWLFLPSLKSPLTSIIISLPAGIFMLAFFSVHFLGFHFVHSIFLNGFFPIISNSPFGKNIGETGIYAFSLAGTALVNYWPFVLASVASRLNEFRDAANPDGKNVLFKPYINVVKMHIMIFVFAGLGATGLAGYAMYPLLVLYFFPFRSIIGIFRKKDLPSQ